MTDQRAEVVPRWSSAPPKVLVVDDDDSVRSSLVRLLEAEGMRVKAVSDGEAGWGAAHQLNPDLILLDVMMPRLDGFEVCSRLKSVVDFKLTPVIMLTGLSEVDDRVRGIEAGADDFLSKPFDRVELLARVRSHLKVKAYTDQLEKVESVLLVLARSIEGKDPYTEGHCERLTRFGSELGRRFELSDDEVVALGRAGILHDIGKIAVPDAVLLKTGPLSDEEWNLMRQHPVTGEHICKPIKSFELVLPIIRHHHEKMDGSGYPDGLEGDEIPFTARILQVVDVFDALSTERPYKPAMEPDRAMELLRQEADRGWWDTEVVDMFAKLLADDESVREGQEVSK